MIASRASTSMPSPLLREAARNCRIRSLCTAALAKDRNGHGLIVELGAVRGRVRRYFAVGIESGQCGSFAEHILNGFYLFADTLAEQKLAPNAAHQDRDIVAGLLQDRLMRRVRRTFNQPVEIAAHELRAVAFRHVSGEGHSAVFFVDRDDG